MSFEDLLALEHRRLAPQYRARRAEHSSLAPYPTLRKLVRKLTVTPKKQTKKQLKALRRERAALLCVLLEAYQRDFDRLWEAIILTALTPMLSIVRWKFSGGDPDDREGLFLAAVGTVIRTVDPRRKPELIYPIIWMKTKKRVTPKLRKEHEWRNLGIEVEADEVPDETMPAPEEYVLVDIVSQANGGEMARARVPADVLARTCRQIEAYVGREFGCLPTADQRAIYEHVRALKARCKDLEGKTLPTPRPRRAAASVPPESGTHFREGVLAEAGAVESMLEAEAEAATEADSEFEAEVAGDLHIEPLAEAHAAEVGS